MQLLTINSKITVTGMRKKVEDYEILYVLEPVIVTAYLNLQISNPSKLVQLKKLTDLIPSILQRRHSIEL